MSVFFGKGASPAAVAQQKPQFAKPAIKQKRVPFWLKATAITVLAAGIIIMSSNLANAQPGGKKGKEPVPLEQADTLVLKTFDTAKQKFAEQQLKLGNVASFELVSVIDAPRVGQNEYYPLFDAKGSQVCTIDADEMRAASNPDGAGKRLNGTSYYVVVRGGKLGLYRIAYTKPEEVQPPQL